MDDVFGVTPSEPPSDQQRPEEVAGPPSVNAKPEQIILPELAPASFRNASPQVGYVGSRACRDCHRDEFVSYLKTTQSRSLADVDDSIVNLRHLSRSSQEDICSQCHLSGSADVHVQGRHVRDFRPGQRRSDFRVSYRIDRPESAMTVSGQIEQMRLSRCYIQSRTMTCATCHNPHSLPEETEKVAYYRAKCLSCHDILSCGLSVESRQAKQEHEARAKSSARKSLSVNSP